MLPMTLAINHNFLRKGCNCIYNSQIITSYFNEVAASLLLGANSISTMNSDNGKRSVKLLQNLYRPRSLFPVLKKAVSQ